MQTYRDVVANRQGVPVAGASVLVKLLADGFTDLNSGTLAVLYDALGNSMANPFVAVDGSFAFSATNGKYAITVTVNGVVSDPVGPVELYDPAEGDLPNINAAVQTLTDLAATTGDALTSVDAQLNALQLADYVALRGYTGDRKSVYVTGYLGTAAPSGIAGMFVRDDADTTTADNGGTVIVTSNGKRWKRQFSGTPDVRWFGAISGSSQSFADKYSAIASAWASVLANTHDLYFPDGDWGIGANNYPWHQSAPTGLLDCKGATIWCAGPQTIFSTTSATGADVFQINALKNFSIRGFPTLRAYLTSTSGSGSNGVSITNGGDNLYFEVCCESLPGIDKGSYVDGGKAFSIQTGGTSYGFGKIRAIVRAKGCVEGFGVEPDLVAELTDKTAIDVELTVEDGFLGVKSVASGATSALTTGMWSGVSVKFTSINCQKDVVVQRAHGIKISGQAVSTKSKANLLLNPSGVQWFAADSTVEALLCNYAKNADIQIDGYKQHCDYKARIGGASAGSSGLTGATEFSRIRLNIGGTADSADILEMDSGGNSLSNSTLEITASTAASIPSAFFSAAKANTIISIGSSVNTQPLVSALRFPAAQSASSDPNALDDYEEGTWTPSFSASGTGSAVFTVTEAKYTKIGRLVYAQFAATRNDASALSGTVTWTLPFAAAGFTNWCSCGTSWVQTIGTGVVVVNNYAANIANLVLDASGNDMTYANLVNGKRMNVSMIYMAA